MQARQGKHSKQQCKRYRANTVTANSKASATRQAGQQPQPAPPKPALLISNHRSPSRHLKRCRRGGPCRRLQAPVRREEPKGGCGVCAAEGFKGNPHFNPAITRPDPPPHRSLAPVPGCYQVWRRGVPPALALTWFVLTARASPPKRRSTSRTVCLAQAGGARGRRE